MPILAKGLVEAARAAPNNIRLSSFHMVLHAFVADDQPMSRRRPMIRRSKGRTMLALYNSDVARGAQSVLRRVSLTAGPKAPLFLVGDRGVGKSSLLHAIGEGSEHPLLIEPASWLGLPLSVASPAISRLGQNDSCDDSGIFHRAEVRRWLLEAGHDSILIEDVAVWPRAIRRFLSVMTALHEPAELYLLDEPTAGLSTPMVRIVRSSIRAASGRACVVVATHDRMDCLQVGGKTALLAGGTVQECSETRRFFRAPATAAGRVYVNVCNDALQPPPRPLRTDQGMWWPVPGLLCGMDRPGVASDIELQFKLLAAEGVRTLICVEEQRRYPLDALRRVGLTSHHFPIPELAPPGFGQAFRICQIVEEEVRRGRGVAVHCRGGLGRGATVLAAALVWMGISAADAIRKVRKERPRAIQTRGQLEFVYGFARSLSHLQSVNQERSAHCAVG